jgi:hypothetical protein
LAFLVGAGLLVVTALVALATLPGRSILQQPPAQQEGAPEPPVEVVPLELEQA